jgi:hypothetical protein
MPCIANEQHQSTLLIGAVQAVCTEVEYWQGYVTSMTRGWPISGRGVAWRWIGYLGQICALSAWLWPKNSTATLGRAGSVML